MTKHLILKCVTNENLAHVSPETPVPASGGVSVSPPVYGGTEVHAPTPVSSPALNPPTPCSPVAHVIQSGCWSPGSKVFSPKCKLDPGGLPFLG